jgi:uncharacterized protein
VVVTQVCPGAVESGFDEAPGPPMGISGGPLLFLKIGAARCVKDALSGFDRGAALVFPGRAYRIVMAMLPLLPRRLRRGRAATATKRLRRSSTGG